MTFDYQTIERQVRESIDRMFSKREPLEQIEADLRLVKWMLGINLAATLAILLRLCA